MLFPAVAALLASLLFTQSAIASLTPTDVITNIKIVTTVSNNLTIYLGDLTVNSDSGTVETFATVSSVNPLMIRALSGLQRLEQDSKTIISDLTTDATAQDATPPYPYTEAEPIVGALDDVSYDTHALSLRLS